MNILRSFWISINTGIHEVAHKCVEIFEVQNETKRKHYDTTYNHSRALKIY